MTTPKKSLTISAAELVNPYIEVRGSLAAPILAVGEKGVLLTGGVAVATGGLSLLARAAWDRVASSPEPCDDTKTKALETLGSRFPDIDLN